MAELSQTHQDQLQAFLKFSSYKRKQHVKEVVQCVNDAIEKIQDGVSVHPVAANTRDGQEHIQA
jgi:hypothetical protein